MRLFVGDDRAEDHHDVEVMEGSGRRLARARLPEGVAGMARLHTILGELAGDDADDVEVLVGIETGRGPWVAALVAAGYTVPAVDPLQAARSVTGWGCRGPRATPPMRMCWPVAHAHELRPVAGDSAGAEAIKVVARTHKTLIWERTRHTQRLRHALRDYFPAAPAVFEDLAAAGTLELLGKAPTPALAARLSIGQISAVQIRRVVPNRPGRTGADEQATSKHRHRPVGPVVSAACLLVSMRSWWGATRVCSMAPRSHATGGQAIFKCWSATSMATSNSPPRASA